MRVGVPSELVEHETRVALIPPAVEKLADRGLQVVLESGAGDEAGWHDDDYRGVGCAIADDRASVFEQADIITQVRGLGATSELDPDPYAQGQLVIGFLGPYTLGDAIDILLERKLTAFAFELMPRISRAQSMDALSSMTSIGGYKSVIVAADALPKMFPMQMTAAGTVRPADVFVVGAGVAGLQAIATARRLGASVSAYDIRPEVKEEVESLGAEFVDLDLETEAVADEGGHAHTQDEDFYRRQREMMTAVIADSDVVITTAAIPGRPAPELVTTAMIEGMEPGSVIVDLAAAGGGNCEPTVADEPVVHEGVTILGPTNLPATVAKHASQLYANNVVNFLANLLEGGAVSIDADDEIINATLLSHDGEIRHEVDDEEGAD